MRLYSIDNLKEVELIRFLNDIAVCFSCVHTLNHYDQLKMLCDDPAEGWLTACCIIPRQMFACAS